MVMPHFLTLDIVLDVRVHAAGRVIRSAPGLTDKRGGDSVTSRLQSDSIATHSLSHTQRDMNRTQGLGVGVPWEFGQ